MLKVGDIVKITKPKDTEVHPVWVSEMDRYDGQVITLTTGMEIRGSLGTLWEIGLFGFSSKWMELASAPADAYDYAMGIV